MIFASANLIDLTAAKRCWCPVGVLTEDAIDALSVAR
jgi:hypothetical protein